MKDIKENKTLKQPKNKKRIDSIREDLKKLSNKLSKSELKEIKKKNKKKSKNNLIKKN